MAELKRELAAHKTQTDKRIEFVELNSFVDRQELLGALMRPKPSLGAAMDPEDAMQEQAADDSVDDARSEDSKMERKLPLHMEKSVGEEISGQFVIPY